MSTPCPLGERGRLPGPAKARALTGASLQVESSQQANAEVMREMTKKLYSQYEEKLQEEQRKHSAEKEALLVCTS